MKEGGPGGYELVFSVEKRKGNPRCFPPFLSLLVKLNANTQKADGLISAQISAFLFGMLSLHLSGQRPYSTSLPLRVLLLLLGLCSVCVRESERERGRSKALPGDARRGRNKGEEYFKIKCVCTKGAAHSVSPNERVSQIK